MRKTPTRCPRASGSPSSRRSLRAADGAWAVSPMPRFTFVAGGEKLGPGMVKGRPLARAGRLGPLVLGRVAVQQVQEAYATGAVVEGTVIRPGDKVRVSAGKIKLTLLPSVEGVKGDLAEAATYELIEALNRTGRFQVALGDAVNVWLAQQGIKRQDVLEGKGLAQVGPRYKVESLLVVAFSRGQGKPDMDVRLFTFPGPNALLTTALFVPPSIKATPKGDFSAAGKPRESQTPAPTRSLLSRLLTGDLDAGTYASGETSMPLTARSEERRVGKECRSRWSP